MQLFAPLTRTYITQLFGRNPSFYRMYGLKAHNGLDMRTKFADTPLGHRHVRPMASGVVIEVGNQGRKGYGRYIRLQHADGSQSVYGHLWKEFVKVGQKVVRTNLANGTVMALTDNTGRSTGSHLHVGIRNPDWKKQYSNGYFGYVDFLSRLIL